MNKEQQKEYLKKWRKNHPHYTRNWNRENRNKYIQDLELPNLKGKREIEKIVFIKGKPIYKNCLSCSILLSSRFAKGGNKRLCGSCLNKNK